MVRPSGTEAPGARRCGQADAYDEPRARVRSWPPLRLARLRGERGSVVVVSSAAPVTLAGRRHGCDRCIGFDLIGQLSDWACVSEPLTGPLSQPPLWAGAADR